MILDIRTGPNCFIIRASAQSIQEFADSNNGTAKSARKSKYDFPAIGSDTALVNIYPLDNASLLTYEWIFPEPGNSQDDKIASFLFLLYRLYRYNHHPGILRDQYERIHFQSFSLSGHSSGSGHIYPAVLRFMDKNDPILLQEANDYIKQETLELLDFFYPNTESRPDDTVVTITKRQLIISTSEAAERTLTLQDGYDLRKKRPFFCKEMLTCRHKLISLGALAALNSFLHLLQHKKD